MSSGHGVNSKQGRCYPFWTEVANCRQLPDSTPAKCAKYVEDFLECLFHRKEVPNTQKDIFALLLIARAFRRIN
jgi:hypothetical protein